MTTTTPSTDSDRLFAGQVGYLRTKLVAALVLLWGPAFVAVAVVALVTAHHRTVGITVVAVFLIAAGLFVGGYVAPRVWRTLMAKDRHVGAYLEVEGGVLRFVSPAHPAAQIELAKVARAEHAYQMPNAYARGGGRQSVLRLFDGHDKKVATWSLWPLQGRAVARWLTRHGVKTAIRR
jgi:hypothetical protein